MKIIEKIRSFKLLKFAFPAAIIGITILATLDSGHLPSNPIKSDKLNHILAFGALTMIALVSYPKTSLIKKIAILVGYGILLELIQFVLPWRSCEIADLIADIIGIVLCLAAWEIAKLSKHVEKNDKKRPD